MRWWLIVGFLVASTASAAEDYPLLTQLQGKWVGKWDGKYGVMFDITPAKSGYDIKYFVEENIGHPYKELKFTGKPINRNTLKAGKLMFVVNMEEDEKIYVVGVFDPGTRITELTRQ